MRNLIVKLLALSYRAKLFGRTITFPRAANVEFPLMLLLGYALITSEGYPMPDVFAWLVLTVNIVVRVIIVVYLEFNPAQWHELTSEQKWFYGNGVKSGKIKAKLTTSQEGEWGRINRKIQGSRGNFYNLWALFLNPILVVILLFLVL